MAKYQGERRSITPNTSNDNWALDAGSGEYAHVYDINWGGELTTSTAMQTRVARSSSGTSATTVAGTKIHPGSPTNLVDFCTAWSGQPTLGTLSLFSTSWNAHGGVVRILLPPGGEFILVGAAHISCRNTTGTGTSSYGVSWEEP